MRRVAAVAVLASLALPAGARAGVESFTGQVVAPTFGSPAVARLVEANAGQNGVFGFVFDVTPAMHGFHLYTRERPTALEDFDIFFYASPGDLSAEPIDSFVGPDDESGSIPASAVRAVVTLSAGVNGTFEFVYW